MSSLYWSEDKGVGGTKVLLATTAYDSPDASYTASIDNSRAVLRDHGFRTAYALLSGNCHVDDARNSIVKHFLESDCHELVFIDADVSWEPAALARLLNHQDVDIIGGVYPKRAEGNHDYPVRLLEGVAEPCKRGRLRVEGLPTGFMRIKRHVLAAMAEKAQQFRKGAELSTTPILFERDFIDGVGRVGGDINFCMKARAAGFAVEADCELWLGHAAKTIVRGSCGAYMRRKTNTTLRWVCEQIQADAWKPQHIEEARACVGNSFGANVSGLIAAISTIKHNPGPVFEVGSGLTTVLMAAALKGKHYVYAVEHDPVYYELTKRMAREAGVKNIGLCLAPIDQATGWYNEHELEAIPAEKFALAFIDGPPRVYGSRFRFFSTDFAGDSNIIIADDADDFEYKRRLHEWADHNNRHIAFEGRLAIMSKERT